MHHVQQRSKEPASALHPNKRSRNLLSLPRLGVRNQLHVHGMPAGHEH